MLALFFFFFFSFKLVALVRSAWMVQLDDWREAQCLTANRSPDSTGMLPLVPDHWVQLVKLHRAHVSAIELPSNTEMRDWCIGMEDLSDRSVGPETSTSSNTASANANTAGAKKEASNSTARVNQLLTQQDIDLFSEFTMTLAPADPPANSASFLAPVDLMADLASVDFSSIFVE
jgi:hypothetical protein